MMHALLDDRLRILIDRKFIQMDDERDRLVQRKFPHPAQDELLGIAVQVLFRERRGVHRIEELPDFPQVQFNPARRVFSLWHRLTNQETGQNTSKSPAGMNGVGRQRQTCNRAKRRSWGIEQM
jgi:hypothetical protein